MLIAVPSDDPGGLEASVSEHFGHCAAFTLVRVDDGEVGEVTVLANTAHQQGGCMAPVMLLKQNDVDTLLAGGMGMRPLAGFQQVGIDVHFKESAATVREAVELHLAGKCRAFGEAQTCGGGGGHCGGHEGHHAEPVEREPIKGPKDVRDGRVISVSYTLKDSDGTVLDSSESSGPMRYLHGAGTTLPGLEKALAGLEPGATTVAELACAEAFGERDESRIMEVPRQQMPAEVQVGMMVTAVSQQGQSMNLLVVHLDDEIAKLDGNHPLAGRDLVFEMEVLDVVAATPVELEHGHVH